MKTVRDDPNIILFTGQSGVDHIGCLKRLREGLDSSAEIVSVEKGGEKQLLAAEGRTSMSFTGYLGLPGGPQRKRWRNAFQTVSDSLADSQPSGYVFLTLHAVYHHQRRRDYVSAVDFDLLKSTLGNRVKCVIVLIDDIYDVYLRLLRPGKMFSYIWDQERVETDFDALCESCVNLISLLHWRETEIAFSRLLAALLKVPMYIVATKHPTSILQRLIARPLSSLKVFYLPHPIANVRGQRPDFVGELNVVVNQIRRAEDRVIFLPDTIDEKRIARNNGTHLPTLLDRWQLPWDQREFIAPDEPTKDEPNKNPLNPRNYDTSTGGQKANLSISH